MWLWDQKDSEMVPQEACVFLLKVVRPTISLQKDQGDMQQVLYIAQKKEVCEPPAEPANTPLSL